jgi:nitrile hydratase accessory protein
VTVDEPTLPRRNGELVFDAPWESRMFGLAMALREGGVVEWERFRAGLLDREDGSYYERWHDALERLLVESGVVSADEIARAADAIAHERAHDHDH